MRTTPCRRCRHRPGSAQTYGIVERSAPRDGSAYGRNDHIHAELSAGNGYLSAGTSSTVTTGPELLSRSTIVRPSRRFSTRCTAARTSCTIHLEAEDDGHDGALDGSGSVVSQRNSSARDGRGAGRELRASRHADGDGAGRLHARATLFAC